jgi:hypothetical protein
MKFNNTLKVKKQKSKRCYIGWIHLPNYGWGCVRKRFALLPTRINKTTIIWLESYYSFVTQKDHSGLHEGMYWALSHRSLSIFGLRA